MIGTSDEIESLQRLEEAEVLGETGSMQVMPDQGKALLPMKLLACVCGTACKDVHDAERACRNSESVQTSLSK